MLVENKPQRRQPGAGRPRTEQGCGSQTFKLSPEADAELTRRAELSETTRTAVLEELLRPELDRRLSVVIPNQAERLKAVGKLMECAPEEVAQLCLEKHLATLEQMLGISKPKSFHI